MHGSYVLYIMYMLLEGDVLSYFITGMILNYLNIQHSINNFLKRDPNVTCHEAYYTHSKSLLLKT